MLPFLLEVEDRAASFLVVRAADFLAAAEVGRAAAFFAAVVAGFLAAAEEGRAAGFLDVELGTGAEPASTPAKTADKTIGRASLITRLLQASTSAPGLHLRCAGRSLKTFSIFRSGSKNLTV